MPPDDDVTAPSSLRQRRQAAATQEIVAAAERRIDERGPAALSLRAVARSLGMTVQALYHYFPNRNALVTALISKTYTDLAGAVQTGVDTATGDSHAARFMAAAESYRRWAITHPERFQLIYGTPLRDYAAPAEGPTTRALRQMSVIFQRELFGGFTEAQLAAADTAALSAGFRAHLATMPAAGSEAFPSATSLLMSAWGHMHGLVVLEVFGHTAFLGEHQAEIFRMSMRNLLEDVHRRITL
ncbi:TetR/AcrR family transcriptional regulator [Actinomadura darangshiensis]|uniref:TetR/AcrR family transcriptional regulator n=1 Tax=Actinomadura darangshiensis TaxID=705336 RepID=A0A4R5BHM1_9ACTN|nr:TetR/AcrR family transcriptional regulator [Actinomadura darangshiensis]TDD84400.1 TetR/AcrR family transcriptional regulator [Actinomadura darangshiensis]